ncbi:ATP-binding protein [Streptomyces sp. RLB3-6]|uniref:ATP-binding protein n=1 Tax=Streptomyces sp. RLB3-6 TaxID=2594457 RepID=UPI0011653F1D|nr:ATP-binding protein [Streptomyces sp. RLB3-6]QDN84366.1 AAA family ATPase [Streptomyces sp. RLB3-6]
MTTIPEPSVIVLIGASGSGKTTLARTWPASYRLELDRYRMLVSGSAGDQDATADAVRALNTVLAARLARGLTCVIDQTCTRADIRGGFVSAAHDHGMRAIALVMDTSLSACQARNARRPDERRVPRGTVQRQAEQIAAARPGLHGEGFDQVVLASQLLRLRPLLQRASDAHEAELGTGSEDGPELSRMLARRTFGSELAQAFRWQWLEDGADPIATVAVGGELLVLTYRTDSDDPGEWGFEAQVPCPTDDCLGPAWVPVWSPTDLLQVYDADTDDDAVVCGRCGVGTGMRAAV